MIDRLPWILWLSRDRRFMLVYSFLLLLVATGDLALFMISVIRILIPECDEGSQYYNEFAYRHCSYRVWFAGEGGCHSNI